ncbi:MAG: hypothetical protein JW864_07140 [Spirochaetes bacterium]|nr:hypothetical protein [Spirochaetota bacterium]
MEKLNLIRFPPEIPVKGVAAVVTTPFTIPVISDISLAYRKKHERPCFMIFNDFLLMYNGHIFTLSGNYFKMSTFLSTIIITFFRIRALPSIM